MIVFISTLKEVVMKKHFWGVFFCLVVVVAVFMVGRHFGRAEGKIEVLSSMTSVPLLDDGQLRISYSICCDVSPEIETAMRNTIRQVGNWLSVALDIDRVNNKVVAIDIIRDHFLRKAEPKDVGVKWPERYPIQRAMIFVDSIGMPSTRD
jgi:hypothetical protein